MSPANKHVLCMVIGLGLIGAVRAGDPFERIRAENEVRKQKLLADVNAALAQSRSLEGRDPEQARDVLRIVETKLHDDVLLPRGERDRLLGNVRDRLVIVNDAIRGKQRAEALAAQKAAVKLNQELQNPPQPPRTTNDIASDFIGGARKGLDAATMDRLRRETGFRDVQRELDRAAAQMTEERITAHFIAITDRRKPKLSKEEQHVIKMLNSTMAVNFDNARFKEVIEYIQDRTEMAIFLDEGSLREAGVEYDDPVSLKVPKATVRTILRTILANKGLAYFVKEGAIQVVTAQRARETMVTRSYPIGDLIRPDPTFGPFMARALMYQQVQQLINVIQASADPTIWQSGGTITFFEPTMTIQVRGPAELHNSLSIFGN